MILVNFGHPLSADAVAAVADLVGEPVEELRQRPLHMESAVPFAEQVRTAVDDVQLDATSWQLGRIVVNLPGLAPAAALVLAELHGRIGGFPPVLRMRRDEPYSRYVVAELLDLQAMRERSRPTRLGKDL